ncbi:MAG: 4Fe-4S binding protein, partial [Candidatus Thermoplasmatota archaeon]|nr:4Fe-4S binding protein [Candidatus Thermoplasmatota archaeon]
VCKPLIQYWIDEERCIGCGSCEKRCPVKAISEKEVAVTAIKGSMNKVREIDTSLCIRCGLCMETCPPKVSAISKRSPVNAVIAGGKGGDDG